MNNKNDTILIYDGKHSNMGNMMLQGYILQKLFNSRINTINIDTLNMLSIHATIHRTLGVLEMRAAGYEQAHFYFSEAITILKAIDHSSTVIDLI